MNTDDANANIRTELTDDVQRLVLRASKLHKVQHIFLHFQSSGAGQEFMCWIKEKISWGMSKPESNRYEIAVGLSFRGLEALNVPDGYLHIFRHLSPAFSEGAGVRAAEYLGDVGTSAASYWDSEFSPEQVHAIITIHGTPETKSEELEWQAFPFLKYLRGEGEHSDNKGKYRVLRVLHGAHLNPPVENDGWHSPLRAESFKRESNDKPLPQPVWVHFGYRDGLTSNKIRTTLTPGPARNVHEPGELLLGEPRNTGDNPWSLVNRSARVRRFYKHSSFGVMRRIEQDEKGFRDYIEAKVDELEEKLEYRNPNALSAFIRAKLCGRWPNGQVVTSEDKPTNIPLREIELNDFDYAQSEQKKTAISMRNAKSDELEVSKGNGIVQGDENEEYGCPFASHIRRMNPRNLDGVQMRFRPLFRRGVPYGPVYPADSEKNVERGLLGMFFCSDLQDQFEHLLGEWADRKRLGVIGDRRQKDPLIGAHTDAETTFKINFRRQDTQSDDNTDQQSFELRDFKPFVRTRGTVYCFYPSSAAMNELGDVEWIEQEDEQWLTR